MKEGSSKGSSREANEKGMRKEKKGEESEKSRRKEEGKPCLAFETLSLEHFRKSTFDIEIYSKEGKK